MPAMTKPWFGFRSASFDPIARRAVAWLVVAACVLAAFTTAVVSAYPASAAPASVTRYEVARRHARMAPTDRATAGFRTRSLLFEHYRKHGREFGDITVEQYLGLARELRDRAPGRGMLELVRRDGVVTRFDQRSGAFLAFDPDGTIRTFFRPRAGERYFRRQASREE